DSLVINSIEILVLVAIKQTPFSDWATRNRDRILGLYRRNRYPVPGLEHARHQEINKDRPEEHRADIRFHIRRPQLKTCPSWGWKGGFLSINEPSALLNLRKSALLGIKDRGTLQLGKKS